MSLKTTIERGDIIYADFAPIVGREMDYARPAIVISPGAFNSASDLIIVCPITSAIKNSPWEVVLHKTMKTHGAVRVDHVKSIDKQRCKMINHRIVVTEKATKDVLNEVLERLSILISERH